MIMYNLYFKHGGDPTKKNHEGHTPLDLVKEGFPDVVDLLRGDVALLEAAKKGNLAKVIFMDFFLYVRLLFLCVCMYVCMCLL